MAGPYVPSWVALRTLHGLMDRDGVQHSFHEPPGDIHELLLVFVLPRQCQSESMLHLCLNTVMLVLSLQEVSQHDLSEHSPIESN